MGTLNSDDLKTIGSPGSKSCNFAGRRAGHRWRRRHEYHHSSKNSSSDGHRGSPLFSDVFQNRIATSRNGLAPSA